MWNPKGHIEKQGGRGIVAVAIDRDKGSQHALRWATERLLTKGQTVVLIHVLKISPTMGEYTPVHDVDSAIVSGQNNLDKNVKDLFVTFHCFCRRKDIHCLDILLEDTDIPRALIEFTNHAAVDNLILGASSKYSFIRFRISAEIATGLLFLHQTKPEPLVHRDLKPGNILLDYNYVSKISDVGLARLVPRSVAENETRCHMTSTAGTFCYIDPEYQQTGVLDVKSDVYSFGIMLLQVITAKPPMGLTHQVEQAIEKGTFKEILDLAVPDWPVEEALSFAKMALQCAELRRKDRPDLGKVILPELNRLRNLAEENMNQTMWDRMADPSGPSPGWESYEDSNSLANGKKP